MNITIPLDSENKEPLYEQIIRYLRNAIEKGELAPGDRLPSKRGLASHLQVSVSTVETAYAQLTAEGYLDARERSGFYVEHRLPIRILKEGKEKARFNQPEPSSRKPERPEFDFSSNRVDAGRFPFSTWAKLMRQVLCEDSRLLLDPGPPQGMDALRVAIARYLREDRGLDFSPEQIVVGAGSETLMSLLVQLLGHSRVYGVEDPGYPKLYRILKSHGVPTRLIPMDQEGLSICELERQGVSVVHVTPSHHFPLGTSMPVGRRAELLGWVHRGEERIILEDDYDSELRYEGRPFPPLAALDQTEKVIYMGSFAKSLAPSFRMGYLALPPLLAERYGRVLSFLSCTLPVIEQLTLARFLEGGYYERHLNRVRKCYRSRRDVLTTALSASPLAERMTLSGAQAGTHLLLTLHNASETDLVERARCAGIELHGLSEYGSSVGNRDATLLLGFAGMEEEMLVQGIKQLVVAWEPLLRS